MFSLLFGSPLSLYAPAIFLADKAAMPDQQICSGKYTLYERIASGGMGEVWRGYDHYLDEIVAIKWIHSHLSSDPSFSELFMDEARKLKNLSHPNIVRFHAVERDQHTYFLVMEFFGPGTLRHVIQQKRQLPLYDVVHIGHQLALALAHAHSKNIMHRDIKPANVLVDAKLNVKLTDFGIAKALNKASLTSSGQVKGTVPYMSPQQASGDPELDFRSDLYSLGILLYEMITGKTPHGEDDNTVILGRLQHAQQELKLRHAQQGFVASLQFPASVSIILKDVVSDLLKIDPDDRIQTAESLAETLADILATLPVPEEPTVWFPEPTPTPSPDPLDPTIDPVPPPSPTPKPLPPPPPTPLPIPLPVPDPLSRLSSLPLKPIIAWGIVLAVILGGYFGYKALEQTRAEEMLKEKEVIMSKKEEDFNGALERLQKGKHTPECSGLKVALVDAYGTFETAARDVNELRQKLGKASVSLLQRPSDEDLTCPPPVEWPDKQLQSMLEKFKRAYETRNFETLRALSHMSESRASNVRFMFENYKAFRAFIQNVVPTKDGATAVLVLDTGTRINGQTIPITGMSKKYTLQIARKDTTWEKIVW